MVPSLAVWEEINFGPPARNRENMAQTWVLPSIDNGKMAPNSQLNSLDADCTVLVFCPKLSGQIRDTGANRSQAGAQFSRI